MKTSGILLTLSLFLAYTDQQAGQYSAGRNSSIELLEESSQPAHTPSKADYELLDTFIEATLALNFPPDVLQHTRFELMQTNGQKTPFRFTNTELHQVYHVAELRALCPPGNGGAALLDLFFDLALLNFLATQKDTMALFVVCQNDVLKTTILQINKAISLMLLETLEIISAHHLFKKERTRDLLRSWANIHPSMIQHNSYALERYDTLTHKLMTSQS